MLGQGIWGKNTDLGLGLGGFPPVSGGYSLTGIAGPSVVQMHGYLV